MRSGIWSNEIRLLIQASICSKCHAAFANRMIEAKVAFIAPKTERAWLTCLYCDNKWHFDCHHDFDEEAEEITGDEQIDLHILLKNPITIEAMTNFKKNRL